MEPTTQEQIDSLLNMSMPEPKSLRKQEPVEDLDLFMLFGKESGEDNLDTIVKEV